MEEVKISASPEAMARFFAAMGQYAGGAHSAISVPVAATQPPDLDPDPLLPAPAIVPMLSAGITPVASAAFVAATPIEQTDRFPPHPLRNYPCDRPIAHTPRSPSYPQWEPVALDRDMGRDRPIAVTEKSGALTVQAKPSRQQKVLWQLQALWQKSWFRAATASVFLMLISGGFTLFYLRLMVASVTPPDSFPAPTPSVKATAPKPVASPVNPPPVVAPPVAPGPPPP